MQQRPLLGHSTSQWAGVRPCARQRRVSRGLRRPCPPPESFSARARVPCREGEACDRCPRRHRKPLTAPAQRQPEPGDLAGIAVGRGGGARTEGARAAGGGGDGSSPASEAVRLIFPNGLANRLAKRRRLVPWRASSQRFASGWGSARRLNRSHAPTSGGVLKAVVQALCFP